MSKIATVPVSSIVEICKKDPTWPKKWKGFAAALHIPNHLCLNIKSDYIPEDILNEILPHWISTSGQSANIGSLVKALNHTKFKWCAGKIQNTYNSTDLLDFCSTTKEVVKEEDSSLLDMFDNMETEDFDITINNISDDSSETQDAKWVEKCLKIVRVDSNVSAANIKRVGKICPRPMKVRLQRKSGGKVEDLKREEVRKVVQKLQSFKILETQGIKVVAIMTGDQSDCTEKKLGIIKKVAMTCVDMAYLKIKNSFF